MLLRLNDVARIIGKTERTVYRYVRLGRLPFVRHPLTNAMMVDPVELHKILRKVRASKKA